MKYLLLFVATLAGAIALATGGTAAAATTGAPPTISVSFTPAEIGVGDSSTITYTITNPNSSGSLYNIGFADALPSTVLVDDPPSITNSGCGSPAVSASPDYASDSVAGITVKAGTPCTIGIQVIAKTAGTATDSLSGFTYATSATGAATPVPANGATTYSQGASLEVVALPTVTIKTPTKNAVYAYGAKVKASFGCTAPSDASGTTLASCLGQDDLGNSINSGGYLDTKIAGKHSLQVEAINTLGDVVNAQVNYTVLPDNVATIGSTAAGSNGALKLKVGVPGAGTLTLVEKHGKTIVGSKTVKVTGKKSVAIALAATKAGKALLKANKNKLKVTLTVSFTPKGGKKHATTKSVTLK